jgi:hypothetical protein
MSSSSQSHPVLIPQSHPVLTLKADGYEWLMSIAPVPYVLRVALCVSVKINKPSVPKH